MKKLLISVSLVNSFYLLFAQPFQGQVSFTKIPLPAHHYQEEYVFDTTIDVASWKNEKKGLNVSFASNDELYFRSETPKLSPVATSINTTAWRGERINIQVLVWSPDTINQVRFNFNDLKKLNGRSVSRNVIKAHMVRYVIGNYPYGAKDVTCGASPYKDLYLMPDRFEEFERFDLPGKSVRPVWITVDIPQSAEAGVYSGTIEVQSEKLKTTLSVNINVQQLVLPKPYDWKHRLDLWQNPWVIAVENKLKPWSEEHKLLLKKHLQLYADAGGKFITTYGVHSPWADNSYMIEGGMINWIKKKDGRWKFDYKIFDEYIALAMSLGIDKAITLYTPIPWGNRFKFIDEKTGNEVYESWPPESKQFSDTWNIFLTDLKKHLQQKNWLKVFYLGINENAMEQTLAAIRVIKAHSKDWRITYAGDWHKELDTLLDDYCFLYGKETDVAAVKARSARGQTTTYYVCCNPPVPNNFVFSPPVEGTWISWYTAAHGYDGFLRWAYDAWPADPSRDARHELWPAGDCFLVYPGGMSCIRFEKLREGIVDFEKIRIVREKARLSSDKEVKSLVQELENHLKNFLVEKDFVTAKIKADVDKGRQLLIQISERLK